MPSQSVQAQGDESFFTGCVIQGAQRTFVFEDCCGVGKIDAMGAQIPFRLDRIPFKAHKAVVYVQMYINSSLRSETHQVKRAFACERTFIRAWARDRKT